MTTADFTLAHDLDKLHNELHAAGIRPELVESDGHTVWLTFPSKPDTAAIEAVLAAHDPTPPPPAASLTSKLANELEKAATFEEAKPALIALLKGAP